jgi:hypothetical protein
VRLPGRTLSAPRPMPDGDSIRKWAEAFLSTMDGTVCI